MLEFQMHDAQMMRRQGMKIRQIAEALGKCERTIHNYLSQPSRPRKKRSIQANSIRTNRTSTLYSRTILRSIERSSYGT
jgi:transposase